MEGKRAIKLTWSTVDHHSESRGFSTIEGARKYAHRKVGAHPEIGSTYAIDAFGVSKIVIQTGTTLAELFPEEPPAGIACGCDPMPHAFKAPGFECATLGPAPW